MCVWVCVCPDRDTSSSSFVPFKSNDIAGKPQERVWVVSRWKSLNASEPVHCGPVPLTTINLINILSLICFFFVVFFLSSYLPLHTFLPRSDSSVATQLDSIFKFSEFDSSTVSIVVFNRRYKLSRKLTKQSGSTFSKKVFPKIFFIIIFFCLFFLFFLSVIKSIMNARRIHRWNWFIMWLFWSNSRFVLVINSLDNARARGLDGYVLWEAFKLMRKK